MSHSHTFPLPCRRVLLVSIMLLAAGGTMSSYHNDPVTGYNFGAPDIILTLPAVLHEISGIALVDSTSFACIQDENGIVFIYDLAKRSVRKQYTFYMDGDYEGITRAGQTLYVLRSDGALFEIVNYTSEKFTLNTYNTGIPADNNEGLCYDADHNRLLIACKSKPGKGAGLKDKRLIYAFDLRTKTLNEKPAFDFNLQDVRKFAADQKINLPVRAKKKGQLTDPVIKFKTSAICLHPITGQLFLLSAADHLLFVFNPDGNIVHIERLDSSLFNKPEGISFFENGDLLLSNEGQDKQPTLLKFNYRRH